MQKSVLYALQNVKQAWGCSGASRHTESSGIMLSTLWENTEKMNWDRESRTETHKSLNCKWTSWLTKTTAPLPRGQLVANVYNQQPKTQQAPALRRPSSMSQRRGQGRRPVGRGPPPTNAKACPSRHGLPRTGDMRVSLLNVCNQAQSIRGGALTMDVRAAQRILKEGRLPLITVGADKEPMIELLVEDKPTLKMAVTGATCACASPECATDVPLSDQFVKTVGSSGQIHVTPMTAPDFVAWCKWNCLQIREWTSSWWPRISTWVFTWTINWTGTIKPEPWPEQTEVFWTTGGAVAFYDSVVASAIFFGVVCWGCSISTEIFTLLYSSV